MRLALLSQPLMPQSERLSAAYAIGAQRSHQPRIDDSGGSGRSFLRVWMDWRGRSRTWRWATRERRATASKDSCRRIRTTKSCAACSLRRTGETASGLRPADGAISSGPPRPTRSAGPSRDTALSAGTRASPRLRRLLRVDDLGSIADATGRAVLADLPYKRHPDRPDGPLTAVTRWLAKRRVKWTRR